MSKQFMPVERILGLYGNRYVALNLTSQEIRRIIEGVNRGRLELKGSPYYEGLRRLCDGEVQFERTARKEETTDTK